MHVARGSVADPKRLLRPDLRAEHAPYTRPPEPSGLVRLHMNEAATDWPEAARRAFLDRLATTSFAEYPEREEELTTALGERLGAPEGGVLLGPSSGALLDLLALAGLARGDTVAYPAPGFSLYPSIVKRHGGVPVPVPVGRELPLRGFVEAARVGARQVWLTLPNNPTGAWRSPDEAVPALDAIAELADSPLVVLDEAYAEFSPRTFRLLPDRYENVVLLRTFSKALASAGLRLGVLVGPPALVAELSRLKLPYSISTPQLLALEIALQHAKPFDDAVRVTIERRDRLVRALRKAEVDVAETAANFLHVAHDAADALAAEGVLARRLPPGTGTRISIGSEDACARVARTLGASMPPCTSGPARSKLLVLDVDGVMIDAEKSFREAVALALAELRPALPWDDALFRKMKRLGGMNNDFRLAAGLLAIFDTGALDVLRDDRLVWDPNLEAGLAKSFGIASERVAHHYETTKASEAPLVTKDEITRLGVPFAILTGRAPHELRDAFVTLGLTCEAVCDSAPHLAKPSPAGLLQLADSFRATDVVFVGDTVDDRATVVRARPLRRETRFIFAGVGPDRASFVRDDTSDLEAPTLRELFTRELFPEPSAGTRS